MSTNFNSNVEALLGKMDSFITTKSVVGEPIYIGGVILLPLVDVSFGVGAGAVDKEADNNKNDYDGGGLGAKITPSAVIVINQGNVQLVNVKNQESINKLIDMVPGILSKLNLGSIFHKDKDADEAQTDDIEESIKTDSTEV